MDATVRDAIIRTMVDRVCTQQQATHAQAQQLPTPAAEAFPPPPYTNSPASSDTEPDSDDDDDEEEEATSAPLRLTLNAAHHIQGSNNLVPTSPSPLADATRFSTMLMAAVNQLNNAAADAANRASGQGRAVRRRAPMKVELTINCGITVVGDRNVIGNVGLKPKIPGAVDGAGRVVNVAAVGAYIGPAAAATTARAGAVATEAVVGAKRAEVEERGEREAKRRRGMDGE